MLAGAGEVAALQHVVDARAHRVERRREAIELDVGILRDQAPDRDPRRVQHHAAEADPLGQGHTDAVEGAAELRPRLAAH